MFSAKIKSTFRYSNSNISYFDSNIKKYIMKYTWHRLTNHLHLNSFFMSNNISIYKFNIYNIYIIEFKLTTISITYST